MQQDFISRRTIDTEVDYDDIEDGLDQIGVESDVKRVRPRKKMKMRPIIKEEIIDTIDSKPMQRNEGQSHSFNQMSFWRNKFESERIKSYYCTYSLLKSCSFASPSSTSTMGRVLQFIEKLSTEMSNTVIATLFL